jgi:Flp pilus assembly protein TadB
VIYFALSATWFLIGCITVAAVLASYPPPKFLGLALVVVVMIFVLILWPVAWFVMWQGASMRARAIRKFNREWADHCESMERQARGDRHGL